MAFERDVHLFPITVLRVCGDHLLAAFENGDIRMWSMTTGVFACQFRDESRSTGACLDMLICDTVVAAAYTDSVIRIWDLYVRDRSTI